jgi:aminopeptidase N
LTLRVPTGWEAVSNTPGVVVDTSGGRTIAFGQTPPLSSYLFSFAAGRFSVDSAIRSGRTLRMYHRETDTAKVAANRDAVVDLHDRALRWLESYTGIPYPFAKFDLVAVPAFQFGGMEHPGAVLYRASSLFLDASATQSELLGRASLIAHETAHMWFGDLVTMEWFDDVWMKEVFANFFAAKIVNPSFPEVDHDLRFFLAHHPAAYEVDRTEGTNPIRQELENLREAGSLYGAIIYQKAPIVMRQLERLIGEGTMREGLREYLLANQFSNASWPDLIELLDARTETDLRSWSRAWVEERGRPTVRTTLERTGDRVVGVRLEQEDPLGRRLTWPQTTAVALGYDDRVVTLDVDLAEASAVSPVTSGLPIPRFVLTGVDGISYGRFALDSASRRYLLERARDLPAALQRGVAWMSLWESLLAGDLAADAFIDASLTWIANEPDELVLQRLLSGLERAFWRFLPDHARIAASPRVERVLWQEIQRPHGTSRKAALFDSFLSVALSSEATGTLVRLWRGDGEVPGLPLTERQLSLMAQELALRDHPDARDLLTRQLERIGNPDRKAHFAFVMPALSPDERVRDSVFGSFRLRSNRTRESWVLDAVRYLNHPLRARTAEKYIHPGLSLVEQIQATGDIFFPSRWVSALLSGHRSRTAAAVVRRFLDERPDYPQRLRGKILQAADELFRAGER